MTRLRLEGDPRRLVVFCAGTSWDGNRFPDQHMAERLARFAPLLYVDPPLSIRAAKRLQLESVTARGSTLTLLAPSLARLTPLCPPGSERRGIRLVGAAIRRRAIRRGVRQLTADRAFATVAASLEPVFGAAREQVRVLYGTDDFVAGAHLMGQSVRRLRKSERLRLREATFAVAVSETLQAKWSSMGAVTHFVPNGVDDQLFASSNLAPDPDDLVLPRPVVGFIGHLSDRIDLKLLAAVADRGHSLLLVGPRQITFEAGRVEALLSRPNVQWVGPKDFHDLPSYMKVIDVGLVPYQHTEFNHASFPLKTLEYLAAGKPVVSTRLPSVEWLGSDLVTFADSANDFANAVAAVLAVPANTELAARRQELAKRHSWDERARSFAALLGLLETTEAGPQGAPTTSPPAAQG
jgi:teichuronic acid biosynthesis glycosyltransferase TuaH